MEVSANTTTTTTMTRGFDFRAFLAVLRSVHCAAEETDVDRRLYVELYQRESSKKHAASSMMHEFT